MYKFLHIDWADAGVKVATISCPSIAYGENIFWIEDFDTVESMISIDVLFLKGVCMS